MEQQIMEEIRLAINLLTKYGYVVFQPNLGESIKFNCKHCGTFVESKKFKDKAAVACEGCGIIWEVKPDGTIELEMLQLVGGKFTDDHLRDPGGMRESAFPEVLKGDKKASDVWNEPTGCCTGMGSHEH